jgi:hypothetical protein
VEATADREAEDAGRRRLTLQWFAMIGLALLAMGLVLGVTPANSDDDECGSAFFPTDAHGTDEEACAFAGGLAERRAWGLALVTGGLVFLVGAYAARIRDPDGPRAPRRTLANRPAPALRKAEAATAPAEADASP